MAHPPPSLPFTPFGPPVYPDGSVYPPLPPLSPLPPSSPLPQWPADANRAGWYGMGHHQYQHHPAASPPNYYNVHQSPAPGFHPPPHHHSTFRSLDSSHEHPSRSHHSRHSTATSFGGHSNGTLKNESKDGAESRDSHRSSHRSRPSIMIEHKGGDGTARNTTAETKRQEANIIDNHVIISDDSSHSSSAARKSGSSGNSSSKGVTTTKRGGAYTYVDDNEEELPAKHVDSESDYEEHELDGTDCVYDLIPYDHSRNSTASISSRASHGHGSHYSSANSVSSFHTRGTRDSRPDASLADVAVAEAQAQAARRRSCRNTIRVLPLVGFHLGRQWRVPQTREELRAAVGVSADSGIACIWSVHEGDDDQRFVICEEPREVDLTMSGALGSSSPGVI